MLRVYKTESQKEMDAFISRTMQIKGWEGYMFAQPDCGTAKFPAQFVIVREEQVKLATIQILH
jgi:hypothetical protein